MIPEVVVVASCLMLTTAQLQIPIQQIIALPNLQPMQITALPNSPDLMTQSAHTIMNQNAMIPISPGVLGGDPVLVSEATQSILDQESRIVGYSLPDGLRGLLQQQQQQAEQRQLPQESFKPQSPQLFLPTTPHIIPITQNDAVPVEDSIVKTRQAQTQPQPQSLSFPVLNNIGQQSKVNTNHINIVPIRAVASLKSALTYQKPSESVSFKPKNVEEPVAAQSIYYDIPPNHPVPPPSLPSKTVETSSNSKPVYYDIPLNHPIPPPSSSSEYYDLSSRSEDKPQHANQYNERPPSSPSNYQPISDDQIVFMRPPPPTPFESFYRPEPERVNDNRYVSESRQPPREEIRYRKQENVRPAHLHESSTLPPQTSPKVKEHKEMDKYQKRKKPKSNRPTKQVNTAEREVNLRTSQAQDSAEAASTNIENENYHDSDSATQPSESAFFAALLQQTRNRKPSSYGNNNNNNNYYGAQQKYTSYDNTRAIVHKHVFVHAAPETYPQGRRVRVIRPPIEKEKHLQIIFVKSPTETPPTETVVELPPMEQPKTLVYVLSKKAEEEGGDVRVISPRPSKPHPPEIYFIRYGDRRDNRGYPVPNLESLDLKDNNQNYNYGDARGQPLPLGSPNSYTPEQLSFLRQKRNKDYGLDVYAPLSAYSKTSQINEITQEEASLRRTNLDAFF